MKLNLLPKHVTKANSSRNALIGALAVAALSVVGSIFLIKSSKDARDQAKSDAEALKSQADAVVARAAEAEALASSTGDLVKNVDLAHAMVAHNAKVTNFYRSMFQYIPSFYRVNSMSYTCDADGGGLSLNMTGTLQTEQQYTDLMLALLRIPGAQTVARGGYTRNKPVLPNVTEANPNPKLILENETPLPDDGYERMNQLVARASAAPTGFLNVGNFGGSETEARGAMPDWHLVNVTVVLKTPGAAPAAGAPAPGAGAPTGPTPPTGPGGPAGPGAPAGGAKAPAAPAAAVSAPPVSYDLRVPDPIATLGAKVMSGGGGFSGSASGAGGPAGFPGGGSRKRGGPAGI